MSFSDDCKSGRFFDCELGDELKMVLKYKDNASSSWDDHIVSVNSQRKSKILAGYEKQLVESHDLDAIQKIKEMIIGDPKLAAGLKPIVFERLVIILGEDNQNSIKGSAACILAFANFDECSNGIKEKATKVLVELMSNECAMISVPVLRALTRLAYVSPDYASFIIENGALEGALAVNVEPVYPDLKIIQNLAKFLVVIVCKAKVPSDKVQKVVTILDKILQIRESNLRYIVRACYALSYIAIETWVTEGKICKNLIQFIGDRNNMVAYSALRVVANIVKLGNSCEIKIWIKKHKFLQCLGRSEICCKPKKFQKEACHIISNIAAKGGTSFKDMDESGLMDALSKLLEVNEFDVRMEAACTIRNVIRGNYRYEENGEYDKRCYSTRFTHRKVS